MTYRVTFESDSFNGNLDAEESLEELATYLDCLIALDSNWLRRRVGLDYGRNPAVPLLYASKVVYAEEPMGAEFWRTIPVCLRHGDCDCEDFAAWLIAEKRVRFGIAGARPVIIPQFRPPTTQQPNGSYLYHIQVWSPDVPGGIDDPSKRKGMP